MAETTTSSQNQYQLNGRYYHHTVSVGRKSLYVWAGDQAGLPREHDSEKKRKFTSNIQHFTFSTDGQWVSKATTGTPPLGVRGYSCTAIDDQLYYFGGWCRHGNCFHNNITQLDTVSLQWRELEPTDATRPVMMRAHGGMISLEHDGVHHLLMIGGLGSKPAVQLPHYKYIQLPNGKWCTNEHSIYNLSSRKWINPSIIGQCIPPAGAFIIDKINNTRAVLFGGLENDNTVTTYSNDIYILEISVSTVYWQCIKKPEAVDQWPVGRYYHSGTIINTGSDCPTLVISGGLDKNMDTLDDCWIFNITKQYWIKLDVPHSVSKRQGHSLSVFIMSPQYVWIMTVGGAVDGGDTVEYPNVVMSTELAITRKGKWVVEDTLDTDEVLRLLMAQSTCSQNHYQLNKRYNHHTVSAGDSLYVWAGDQVGLPEEHDSEEKKKFTSNIQYFTPSTGQWVSRATTGTPPLGVIGYSCTAIDDQLYYFGGWCCHGDCYHNNITQLDTVSLQWRELEPTDADRPVMRRESAGMISIEHDGVHHLLMIGGYGSKPAVKLPHYKYVTLFNGGWRTNEHSIYNLSSRKWSNPSIIGQCIPPACAFIIDKINNTRAVLFGGLEDDGTVITVSNNIYILEISVSTVYWQRIKKPEAVDQWPVGRWFHSGAVINTGSDCPTLVISGGMRYYHVLNGCWIFNITKHYWKQLDVPHSVSVRQGHSLSVFTMSPHCVWIITVGGAVDGCDTVEYPNVVMSTELDFCVPMFSEGEWVVSDTLDTDGLNNEDYKSNYHQQLQAGRKKWLEENRRAEQTIQALIKNVKEKQKKYKQQLEEKEQTIQAKENEKVRDAQRFRQQLKQKEAEKEQEIQNYRRQLQEKSRELCRLQSQDAVYQQQVLTGDYWVINKDEVILTREKLGSGSYATVNVGTFRGLRVAVKSLHNVIISNYNLALFSREMSIASRVRHPNLVQFIGATKVGNPLILTELMSASLHAEIQKNQLTKQQILSIAQDVALGLNYLHLFKPQPIIHRDISSPNILLKSSTGPAGYEAKVADYGTAKLLQATSTGTVMPGNPSYAAPEAPVPDEHSPAMDVYSYSVLLMEITLRSPPEMTRVERKQQSDTISWSPMKSLVQRGLSNNCQHRPTMSQVIEALREIKV